MRMIVPRPNGNRSQYVRRITEFADKTGLKIRMAYHPPYHGKHNPIGRCRGVSERHRNGTLPNSVEKTVRWAASMTRKGMGPVVRLPDKVYRKGVKVSEKGMKIFEKSIRRSESLPKWDVTTEPIIG